jgi:hypothetical protein
MRFPFDAKKGLVVVRAEITGPSGVVFPRLALDTGATQTLINTGLLVAVGYDPAVASERVEVTTGSGVEFVARLSIRRIASLAFERTDFAVLAHTLPPSAGVDGVLGLDFLRGHVLTIDFCTGHVVFGSHPGG